MSLFCKVEAETEAKAPAYTFHEVNSKRISETVKICPKYFQRVDLKEGEWGEVGSVMCWYFLIGKTTLLFSFLIWDIILLLIMSNVFYILHFICHMLVPTGSRIYIYIIYLYSCECQSCENLRSIWTIKCVSFKN